MGSKMKVSICLILALAVTGQKLQQQKNKCKMSKKCKKNQTCKTAFTAECSINTMKSEMTSFTAKLGSLITHGQCAEMIDEKMANQKPAIPHRGRQVDSTSPLTEEPMPAANRTTIVDEYISNSTISDELKDFMIGLVDIMREGRKRNKRPGKEGRNDDKRPGPGGKPGRPRGRTHDGTKRGMHDSVENGVLDYDLSTSVAIHPVRPAAADRQPSKGENGKGRKGKGENKQQADNQKRGPMGNLRG